MKTKSITRRTSIFSISSLALTALGCKTHSSIVATEENSSAKDHQSQNRDPFIAMWSAAYSTDLRHFFFDQRTIEERINNKLFVSGSSLSSATETPVTEGRTIKEYLQESNSRRFREWNLFPPLVIVKSDQIKLGSLDREFLDMTIEPGDILIIGGIM